MADDLDDFFAKKDKKKTKKGKIANSVLAKKLEKDRELEKKREKKKEKPVEVTTTEKEEEEQEQKPEKEEEWAEYEEEKEVDYSGLKIQKLEISESADDGEEFQGEGEDGGGREDENNPWKVSQGTEQEQQEEKPEELTPVASPPAPTSYIPPQRRALHGGQVPFKPRGPGWRKTAPDITNPDAFPSLHTSVATEPTGAWGKKLDAGFESVRHGSRVVDTQESQGPKLILGNMYTALQDS